MNFIRIPKYATAALLALAMLYVSAAAETQSKTKPIQTAAAKKKKKKPRTDKQTGGVLDQFLAEMIVNEATTEARSNRIVMMQGAARDTFPPYSPEYKIRDQEYSRTLHNIRAGILQKKSADERRLIQKYFPIALTIIY
jgi:hypothetical protein